MNVKEVNHIIKEVLSGNRVVSYHEFEKVMELFGLYNMRSFCEIDAKFIITCDLPANVSGRCCGLKWIKVKKDVIKNIYRIFRVLGI